MAGLELLVPYIYHEKQEEGSMLCAQHALNSLLQGNYFTPPDLSDIARSLDQLEESYDDSNRGGSSTNMDDTGFFSVQVLDNALKVWGLNLSRWRSEEMRPYQDQPQAQLGFILNLQQHWFTLRRFGQANPNVDLDDGNGHWFNLNSFLPEPEWVGKLYLGMVLQQAEAEGYSVFAVTQADSNAPLAVPRTEADMIAATLPEPTSASRAHLSTSRTTNNKNEINDHPDQEMNLEDEDLELQAALQASLMGRESASSSIAHPAGPSRTNTLENASTSGTRTPSYPPPVASGAGPMTSFLPGHADVDPITAGMERNKVLLQRMREQQEFAQREIWSGADLSLEEQTALQERREQRKKQEEEEEEELRRAIEESQALAEKHQQERAKQLHGQRETDASTSRSMHYNEDGDAELQAALKASLEHSLLSPPNRSTDKDDTESILSDTTSNYEELNNPAPTTAPSLDEIRQRRLARFGK